MESLYNYILEARERVGSLPFSVQEFENFMQDAIIDANYDDSQYWDILKDKFCEKYPEKLWRVFTSICEKYLELKDTTIEEFYNSFANIPIDRINNVLGAGSNGVVLKIGVDKVLKLFYGDDIKKCDEPFIKWCYSNESNVFPKVYKIGKNWCTMELLSMHTGKCQLYINTLDKSNINGKSLFRILADNKYQFDKIDTSTFTDIQLEVFNWCKQVSKEMEDMNSRYIKFPGDLVINNIGERKDGKIIFFDV